MIDIKQRLSKRRKITFLVLFFVWIVGTVFSCFYSISPPSYVPVVWQMRLVYILILYKVIELLLFYLFFYRRHYIKVLRQEFHFESLVYFEKNAKKFFFLVPQGSIVFGILSYKLSSQVGYLWLFLSIATVTLWLVNPQQLEEEL